MTEGQVKEPSWVSEHVKEIVAFAALFLPMLGGLILWMNSMAREQGAIVSTLGHVSDDVKEIKSDVKALTTRPIQQQQQAVTVDLPEAKDAEMKRRLYEDAHKQILGALVNGNLRRTAGPNGIPATAGNTSDDGLGEPGGDSSDGTGAGESKVAGGNDASESIDAAPNAVSAAGVQ